MIRIIGIFIIIVLIIACLLIALNVTKQQPDSRNSQNKKQKSVQRNNNRNSNNKQNHSAKKRDSVSYSNVMNDASNFVQTSVEVVGGVGALTAGVAKGTYKALKDPTASLVETGNTMLKDKMEKSGVRKLRDEALKNDSISKLKAYKAAGGTFDSNLVLDAVLKDRLEIVHFIL